MARGAAREALQRRVAGGGRRREQRAGQVVEGGAVQQGVVRALELALFPGILRARCAGQRARVK